MSTQFLGKARWSSCARGGKRSSEARSGHIGRSWTSAKVCLWTKRGPTPSSFGGGGRGAGACGKGNTRKQPRTCRPARDPGIQVVSRPQAAQMKGRQPVGGGDSWELRVRASDTGSEDHEMPLHILEPLDQPPGHRVRGRERLVGKKRSKQAMRSLLPPGPALPRSRFSPR